MKTRIVVFTIIVGAALLWGGCADLKNGLPPPVAPGVQAHLPSWMDTASTNFHGKFVAAANGNVQSCLVCHGQDYNGGTSNVSCVACHQQRGATLHGRGWVDPSSANFHGKAIAANGWDMRPCQTCHGETYAGGRVPSSCRTCHTGAGGPENCATCHGSANPAPPRDLSGNTAKTARGVGAHQTHFLGSTIAVALFCNECHVVPGPTYAPGHIDNTPGAEVVMNNALARTKTNKPGTPNYTPSLPLFSPNPAYDTGTLKCSSTYCHGNFKNGNVGFAPTWNNATGSEMACGTCHGDTSRTSTLLRPLPKTAAEGGSHPVLPQGWTCANCHVGVIDANLRIIDVTKHINGKISVGGVEQDY